jgi:hypothetical protein
MGQALSVAPLVAQQKRKQKPSKVQPPQGLNRRLVKLKQKQHERNVLLSKFNDSHKSQGNGPLWLRLRQNKKLANYRLKLDNLLEKLLVPKQERQNKRLHERLKQQHRQRVVLALHSKPLRLLSKSSWLSQRWMQNGLA